MAKRPLIACGLLILFGGGLLCAPTAEKPAAPSYATDVKPFLEKYCVECHQRDREKGGINVESHRNLVTPYGRKRKQAVIPGNPDRSRLLMTLEGRGKQMPPKKSAQPTREEVKKLRDWIAAGAADDTKSQP